MPIVNLNGIALNYALLGDPSGFPLVLLHGFMGNLDAWRPQVQAFSRYRLVLYDLRGHGASSAPPDMSCYSISIYTDDLRGLLEHLQIEKAYLLGMDFGGVIALHFALAHPAKTAALILGETIPAFDRPDYDPVLRREAQRLIEEEALARKRGMEVVAARRWQEAVYANPKLGDDPVAERAFIRRYTNMDRFGFLGAAKIQREREDLLPRLHELTMPVLIVAGERDSRMSGVELLHWAIPQSRLAVIEGVGAGTNVHRPRAFNETVLAFLDLIEKQQ